MPLNHDAFMLRSPAVALSDTREVFLDKYGGVYVKPRNISLRLLHSKDVFFSFPLSGPRNETKVGQVFDLFSRAIKLRKKKSVKCCFEKAAKS